jgi:hypothetical protein
MEQTLANDVATTVAAAFAAAAADTASKDRDLVALPLEMLASVGGGCIGVYL